MTISASAPDVPAQGDCPLCCPVAEHVVWHDASCRAILVDDADYPGFVRVIWQRHVREMSDLPGFEQRHLMNVVFAVETALRGLLQPDKINLASLGNVVPHLHWHVIPRFRDDRHFPDPIWAAPSREAIARTAPDPVALGVAIESALTEITCG